MANSTLRGKALFKNAANTVKVANSVAGKIGPKHPLAKQMYGDVLVLVDSFGSLLHPISSDPSFRKKARWFGRNLTKGTKNAIALSVGAIGGPAGLALAGGGILIGFAVTHALDYAFKYHAGTRTKDGEKGLKKERENSPGYWKNMGIIITNNKGLNEVMNMCAEFENDRQALLKLPMSAQSCDDCWRLLEHLARCELRVHQVSAASRTFMDFGLFMNSYMNDLGKKADEIRSKAISKAQKLFNLSPEEMLKNLSASAHHKTVFNTGGFIYGSYGGGHEEWVKATNPELSGGGGAGQLSGGDIDKTMGLSDIYARNSAATTVMAAGGSLGYAVKNMVARPSNMSAAAAGGNLGAAITGAAIDALQAYYDAKALAKVHLKLQDYEAQGVNKFEILAKIDKQDVEALRKEVKIIFSTLCNKISEIDVIQKELSNDADYGAHFKGKSLEDRCVRITRFVKLFHEIVEIRKVYDAFYKCTFDRTMSFEFDKNESIALPMLSQTIFKNVDDYIKSHAKGRVPCSLEKHVCYMDSGNGMEAECKLHHIESPPQVDKTRWEGIPVHPGPSGLSEYAKKHGMASTGLRRTLNEKKTGGKSWF